MIKKTDRELLIRIDERQRALCKKVDASLRELKKKADEKELRLLAEAVKKNTLYRTKVAGAIGIVSAITTLAGKSIWDKFIKGGGN